jgi:subtilisin family serine protease
MHAALRWAAAVLTIVASSLAVEAGTVTPNLERLADSAAPDERIPVVVLMEAFPEVEDLLADVRGLNRSDRRRKVVSRLRRLAEDSQLPVRSTLAASGDDDRRRRVLWGINGMALEATPLEIERLAATAGVRWVLHDHGRPRPGVEDAGRGPTGGDASGPNPDASVTGDVVAMGAQQVWDQLGYTGNGVIVAVVDTGIDRAHPDLADHIWTNLGEVAGNGLDDDGNGYVDDTWGWDFCLDSNDPSAGAHGTQVAGQVAGDGTNGTVTGMAPDAELMSLGIDCDTPSRSWEASDYAIAQGAHVITQSYSWWWTDQPDYEAFRRQTDAELAAGVLHVNSAGNGGTNPDRPIPYNISAPAGSPAPWIHPDQTLVGGISSIIAVGNIDWSTDLIAPSSSLGPAAWEDIIANTDPDYPHAMPPEYQDYPYENGAQMGLLKPDVSAYGNGTTSTCPGPSYCGFSGTSSAAPHVSGTVALMLQANPEATPAELAEALMTTAEHRGDPGKNNVYGSGLVQTFAAVQAVESGVVLVSHVFDDVAGGNGDLAPDPGELGVLSLAVESRTDATIDDLEAILSTTTPGVTIHDRRVTFPSLAAGATAGNDAPHFSLSIAPDACSTIAVLDVELRYGGSVRRATITTRVGDEEPLTLLDDDFESPSGWTSDPGATRRGEWVREDPIGEDIGGGQLSNPEDDTTPPPGVTCWVTGNGSLSGQQGPNNNDVDEGTTTLLSPLFGAPHILELSLSYDRWYYDDSSGGDSFKAEISNDDGMSWTTVEQRVTPTNGWGTQTADLLLVLEPGAEMRLRFSVTDGSEDTLVEGAVDEILISGMWVNCQDHTPAAALPPNPVGDTLLLGKESGHALLSWQAPPVDGGHDAASLYRIEAASLANGSFAETGSATSTQWYEIDAAAGPPLVFYSVRAENAGGSE